MTGHTGFKGVWLVLWLHRLSAHVTGFALDPDDADESLFARTRAHEVLESITGDVRDLHSVVSVFERSRPEIVFHLAAQALVRRSYEDPVGTIATNVMGTANVLEAARRTPSVRAVIVVTSDKSYANEVPARPRRETDPMGGADPYSASKGCAELITGAYRRSFFESGEKLVATARAGNVIGLGDTSVDRIVPDIVRSIVGGDTIAVRNPTSVRPWQHVLEPLRGYLTLGSRLLEGDHRFAEAWNFGPDAADAIQVQELVRRIVTEWGTGTVVHRPDPGAPHEAPVLTLDIAKARSRLGFEPALNLDDAVRLTVTGYKKLIDGSPPARDIVGRQLEEYMELLR